MYDGSLDEDVPWQLRRHVGIVQFGESEGRFA
jgi:hypothetical protein